MNNNKHRGAETGRRIVLKRVAAALLFGFAGNVLAATPAPGAGTILQEIKPTKPPEPSSGNTGLQIEQPGGRAVPATQAFLVRKIRITGNTRFDTATLHALVAEGEGKQLTLGQLEALAAKITAYYHAHGYPLARAIIPAQTIRNATVEIEVIEARYGRTVLHNTTRVNGMLLATTLTPIHSGDVINAKTMNRALLLLSDIPGVAVNATLKPGKKVGTADMIVATTLSTPAVTGQVSVDNYGNKSTGRMRAVGTVNFINAILHYGDVLSLSAMSSGTGMNYGRISYDTLVDGNGTHVGGSYSALRYILGDTLASLNGHGSAQIFSLWTKHPFIRSRRLNLYGRLQYDNKRLQDHIDTSGIRTDRHLNNLAAMLSGDFRDSVMLGSVNSWSVELTSGRVGFDDAAARAADTATAGTQGTFTKLDARFARLQGLTPSNGLYLSFYGQWANTNLDSAEKMVVGGPYTVRAYDMGAVSGDSGYLGTAEFRHDMGSIFMGQWQTIAFVDSEHVRVNRTPWTTGTNSTTLSGMGIGFDWTGQHQWTAKAYIAAPIGPTPTLVASTSSVRGWLEVGKGF